MKNAVVFLTRSPLPFLIDFATTLTLDYDVFICVDEFPFCPPEAASAVTFISCSDEECIADGYQCLTSFKKATAWDKAMRYFATQKRAENADQENAGQKAGAAQRKTWFIEDDVLIPNRKTLQRIDEKYPDADLLSAPRIFRDDEPKKKWHWHWAEKSALNKPWARSYVCALRLSDKMLRRVQQYAEKYKRLEFLEFFFHSLALATFSSASAPSSSPSTSSSTEILVECPEEMKSIVYRGGWRQEQIRPENLYHSIKRPRAHIRYHKLFFSSYSRLPFSSSFQSSAFSSPLIQISFSLQIFALSTATLVFLFSPSIWPKESTRAS